MSRWRIRYICVYVHIYSAARANMSHMHYEFMASINIKFINSQGVVAHHLQRILSGAAAAATTAAATATLFGQINNEKEK